jgi:probable rRNA maturation factor
MTVTVHIDYATSAACPNRADFQRWVEEALRVAQHQQPTEMSILINTAEEMAALNQRYRNKIGPTNVLSFPVSTPSGVNTPLLGDIIICADVVGVEARQQNKQVTDHWAHLTIHGVLHLLGHDHLDTQDAVTMETLEIAALKALTINNPYHAIDSFEEQIPL